MPPELVILDSEVVAVRLAGQEFPCESETFEATIPKKLLAGFRLSEIPEDLTIKPVESVTGTYIEINNDIGLSRYADGSASAFVQVMQRRKYWDGEVGLTPYIEAFRQAIRERSDAEESDFQDDGDYIFLHYEITISDDIEIGEAIKYVEGTRLKESESENAALKTRLTKMESRVRSLTILGLALAVLVLGLTVVAALHWTLR